MTMSKKNKKLFFFLFIILILILVLILFYLLLHKKEPLSLTNNYTPKHLIPVPFNRKITDTTLKKIATQIIGNQNTPIYIIDNFLSPQECQTLIESTKGKLVPSPLTRQDPDDPDYLWAIVKGNEIETGSVSKSELENVRVKPFGLGLERDLYFDEINAKELWDKLNKGEHV